jgi:inhibitor of KinA
MSRPSIVPLGEQAIVVEYGPGLDPGLNDRVLSLHRRLMAEPFPGYIESVPAYSSLTVCLDAEEWRRCNGLAGTTAVEGVMKKLERLASEPPDGWSGEETTVVVPVCYDARVAPDIDRVAGLRGIPTAEVVRLHTSMTYRVYMNGFVPGFPYLGILPAALEVPRKSTPSLRIPAGSVAIAGRQTGIYPFETPGGWQVIGRTPWKLFDKSADPCCLLRPGMKVCFEPIDLERLNASPS